MNDSFSGSNTPVTEENLRTILRAELHTTQHRSPLARIMRILGFMGMLLWFAILILPLVLVSVIAFRILGSDDQDAQILGHADINEEHTALIKVSGIILDSNRYGAADHISANLRRAFENENSKGIILELNTPGGSPVQAGYIHDEILRLRAQYPDKPVYATATDLCLSGGMYIAAAAEEIYANQASLVGSIGVIYSDFGLVGAAKKLGVERRLITAGRHKALLDPFLEADPKVQQHLQHLLNEVHEQFKTVIRNGRGDRIAEQDEEILFSGLLWNGEEAMQMGLVDGIGDSSYVARELIKAESIVNYSMRSPSLGRFIDLFEFTEQALARVFAQGGLYLLP